MGTEDLAMIPEPVDGRSRSHRTDLVSVLVYRILNSLLLPSNVELSRSFRKEWQYAVPTTEPYLHN